MTKETIEQVLKFRDERNWKQFHNPKDLAISISLEAAELLEVFQWSAEDVWCGEKKDKIREELADVLNYCILMADTCGLDMDEIIQEKVRKNAEKYPVEKAYGARGITCSYHILMFWISPIFPDYLTIKASAINYSGFRRLHKRSKKVMKSLHSKH